MTFVVTVSDVSWFVKLLSKALRSGKVLAIHEVPGGMHRGRCRDCYRGWSR